MARLLALEAGALGAPQNGLACCMVCQQGLCQRPVLLSGRDLGHLKGLETQDCYPLCISLYDPCLGLQWQCVLCCPASAGASEEARFGSATEGLEEGDPPPHPTPPPSDHT